MAKLYFRYGLGKSAQLCQVAYNYFEQRNMEIAVINAKDNETIRSRIVVDGKNVLVREPNFDLKPGVSLYEKIYLRDSDVGLKCILVDNAEYLKEEQAEDLFYISKMLDIPVIAYGNRLIDEKKTSLGVCRLMALADDIEKIDMSMPSKRATLDFNYGAMNCSKTAQLLTKDQSLIDEGFKTCIIKPKLDRDELYIASRIGLRKKADIILDLDDNIYGQAEYLYRDRINHILVDEAQFLTPRQIEQLRRIVNDYNMPISCYGLKSDFLSNLFPGSQRLLEISDNIYKMNTVCSCGCGANFNVRKDRFDNYVTEGEQVCIDQGDNYDSECALCFMEHVMKIDTASRKRVRKK
ncbi:MAG: hypothetical protein IJE89_04605 [Bacilli bacterium]|nr:hypothetical protein [Bacilli bacterium]